MSRTGTMKLPASLTIVLLAAACSGQTRPAPAPRPAPVAEPVEVTSSRSTPPLSLDLAGKKLDEGDGLVELTLTLTISGRLPAPPTLTVNLPDGASLSQGEAREELPAHEQGKRTVMTRVYRVRNLADGLVTITVEAVSKSGGAYAEAVYPPRDPGAGRTPPERRSIPRARIGGENVNSAVPIE